MEKIRRALEETTKDVDRKLEEVERCKAEHPGGVKVYGGGRGEDLSVSISDEDLLGVNDCSDEDMVILKSSSSNDDMELPKSSSSSDEDQGGEGKTKEGEDDDETEEDYDETEEEDDAVEWEENDYRWLPYGDEHVDPRPLCTVGVDCTPERAETISEFVCERNVEMIQAWADMVIYNKTPLPARPMPILPEITTNCTAGGVCYHREYWTDISSETEPGHPYFRPCEMLQVFSLRLSSTLAHSVDIYGTFAVRDCWDPRRNYLFKRSRDCPATIAPGCSSLPLVSPCRGIFVLQYLLLDIDLWIKEEGSTSPDQLLFSGYIELDMHLSGFESKLIGQIQGKFLSLDMHYAFLYDAIETVIEVLAVAEKPSDVKISAFTSGFDEETMLYDGTFCGTGLITRHFIAVRNLEELQILLELDGSIYRWIFQAGVGVIGKPDDPISGFAQCEVNVSFRTKGKSASTWQWRCMCNEVRVAEMCL